MKKVSFKAAEAIKRAGYPQYGHCDEYYDARGKAVDKMCDMHKLVYPCPTYLEVWPWLWQKGLHLCVDYIFNGKTGVSIVNNSGNVLKYIEKNVLEDAIVAAVEWIVENKMIK